MENVIKFVGNNEKLFSRVVIENLSAKLTLIVPETHNAILIKDGQMLQTLSSGKYLIGDFIDVKTEADSALEVLFMSKTAKLKMRWGTPQKLLMFDEKAQENYRAGFSGDFEVQVGDPRKCYLYLVGAADDLTADALQERLQSNVVSVMETVVVDFVRANKVPFNQIAVFKKEMSQKILNSLSHKLQSEYGIAVFSFNIANIIIDEADYNRLTSAIKGEVARETGFAVSVEKKWQLKMFVLHVMQKTQMVQFSVQHADKSCKEVSYDCIVYHHSFGYCWTCGFLCCA